MQVCGPREAQFVKNILSGVQPGEAYARAGYQNKNPSTGAKIMQCQNPRVIQALKFGRRELAMTTGYTALAAVKELNETIDFAKQTENATAMARAVELKMKLMGLLVERHEVKQANFNISIGGIDDPRPTT